VIYRRKVLNNKERVKAYVGTRILSSSCFSRTLDLTKFLIYKMLLPLFGDLLSDSGIKQNEIQEELMMKTNSVNVLNEKVTILHNELERKTGKIAALEVDVLACKMLVCSEQSANESQRKIIANLQRNVVELKSQVSEKLQKIADLSSAAEKYVVELDMKTLIVEELTAEVQQLTDRIANFELLVKCSRVEIKEKSEEIKTYAAINSSLTMEVQEKNILIDSLRIDALNNTKEVLKKSHIPAAKKDSGSLTSGLVDEPVDMEEEVPGEKISTLSSSVSLE